MVYGRCSLLMHWSFASRNTGNQRRLLYVYINAVGKYRVKLSAMTNMLETMHCRRLPLGLYIVSTYCLCNINESFVGLTSKTSVTYCRHGTHIDSRSSSRDIKLTPRRLEHNIGLSDASLAQSMFLRNASIIP